MGQSSVVNLHKDIFSPLLDLFYDSVHFSGSGKDFRFMGKVWFCSVYQKDRLSVSSVNFVLRVYQGMRSESVLTAYIAFTNEVPLLLPHQDSQLSHFAPKWTPFIRYILIPYSLVRKTILGLPPSMVLINLENKIFLGAKITGLALPWLVELKYEILLSY